MPDTLSQRRTWGSKLKRTNVKDETSHPYDVLTTSSGGRHCIAAFWPLPSEPEDRLSADRLCEAVVRVLPLLRPRLPFDEFLRSLRFLKAFLPLFAAALFMPNCAIADTASRSSPTSVFATASSALESFSGSFAQVACDIEAGRQVQESREVGKGIAKKDRRRGQSDE